MPNWSNNRVKLQFTSHEEAVRFLTNIGLTPTGKSEEFYIKNFNEAVVGKMPDEPAWYTKEIGKQFWYDWNCYWWGTKWEATSWEDPVYIDFDGELTVYSDYQTAWSPNTAVIDKIYRDYECRAQMFSIDEGNDWVAVYANGVDRAIDMPTYTLAYAIYYKADINEVYRGRVDWYEAVVKEKTMSEFREELMAEKKRLEEYMSS